MHGCRGLTSEKKLRMNRFDLERYGRTQLGLEVGQACR